VEGCDRLATPVCGMKSRWACPERGGMRRKQMYVLPPAAIVVLGSTNPLRLLNLPTRPQNPAALHSGWVLADDFTKSALLNTTEYRKELPGSASRTMIVNTPPKKSAETSCSRGDG